MTKEEFISSISSANFNWRKIYKSILSYDFQDNFENQEINTLFSALSLFFRQLSETYDHSCTLISRSIKYYYISKITEKIKSFLDISIVYTYHNYDGTIIIKVNIPSINKTRYYRFKSKGFLEISKEQFDEIYIDKIIDNKYSYLTLTEMEKSDAILA